MNIAFFETEKWEKDYLSQRIKDYQLSFLEKPLTIENVNEAQNAEIISVFIYSKIDKAVLDKLPNLKLIATQSTGFDHIDIEECKKRNIVVCNVPFYGENTVAEHTFALILSISRNIHKSYLRTTREDYTIEGLKGFDLKGKTIGVIGTGHIGEHVIRIAKGFEMNVLAFDVKQNSELATKLGFQYVSLEDLLKQSDIITLHAPYNENTHHMINKENIGLIKPGAVLINTSRGGLVDTEALIEALDKKLLSGVGLDVLEGEELIKEEKQLLYDPKKINDLTQLVKDHILLSRDNVVFTPHIAFYSQEALERILDTTIENIKNFIAGIPSNKI
ncbi:MAG: hydroxyacid dehydrogenase [Candidatus Paceibacterota bacterium]|jgi:D-lactate dehydrogenase